MTGVCFELTAYNLGKVRYLKIHLTDPLQRVLSAEKLPLYAQKSTEKDALEMLIAEEKQFRERISKEKSTLFAVCHVSPRRAFDCIKALGATGRLTWQGRKVVVDPFTAIEIFIEAVHDEDAGSLFLTGKWRNTQHQGSIMDCEWIFAGDPGFCIKNRICHPIAFDGDSAWIDWIYPKPTAFQGAEAARIVRALHACDGVQIFGLKSKKEVISAKKEPIPFLKLLDRHGAFANLWFDYAEYGQIAAHDPSRSSWRHYESEKGWEKDLLETDFVKKLIDSSHYYCPLDKVSKSLTFILDIGWKIFDHRDKQVLRQKKEEIYTETTSSHILIRGHVDYETHSADLKDLIGAFNRNERFIDLSPTTVGLLDMESAHKWAALTEHEVICDAVAVKKYRLGELSSFFASDMPPARMPNYAELFRALPQGWEMASGEASSAFQGELFVYQREGVKWLEFLRQGDCGGLLADEMGLGKTVQVVAFFSQLTLDHPCLIIVPTSLVFHWKREFERFLPSAAICVYAGKERSEQSHVLDSAHIIITSYAIVRLETEVFRSIPFQVIVLDEAQTIKNPESQIAQAVFSLKGSMRLAITGTPIENRLQDLWSIFHFLLPHLLGTQKDFQATLNSAGSDGRYLERVRKKIRPFLLRRKKEGVLQQLPPKMEQVVWVEMAEEQRQRYDHWLQHTKAGLIQKISMDGISSHRMEILEAILRLRQLCVHPWLVEKRGEGDFFALSGKSERLFLDLQEIIEEGKKVLIYSQFTTMLHLIRREVANKGWSYVYLDGSTTDRESVVRQFQEDASISIFLISLKAGGVGLNLTAADYVFLVDPWWNDAVEQQAIDRAHRFGRKEAVIARRYVTALSIEEKIMHLKKHKLSLSQGLFEEGGDLSSLHLSDLLQLIVE